MTNWRSSLPIQFMFIQLFVAAVIIIASIWFIKSIEQDRLIDNQTSLSINLGNTIIAKLQQKTNRIENLAVSLGAVGESYQSSPFQLDTIVPAILEQSDQQHVLLGGGIWPEPYSFNSAKQKNSYFWSRNNSGQLMKVDDYNDKSTSTYFEADWYLPARYYPTDTTYWSKSYVDPYTNNAMLTASVPMWSNHKFIGVSTVDVALSSIDSFLKTATESQGGYVFALDQQNRLLSYPEIEDDNGIVNSHELFLPFAEFAKKHPDFNQLQVQLATIEQEFIKKANSNKAYSNQQLANVIANAPANERDKLIALINQNANNKLEQVEVITSLQLSNDPKLNEPVLVTVFLMPSTYWKIVLVTPISAITQSSQALANSVGFYLVIIQILALMLLFVMQNKLFITPISRMVRALNDSNPAKVELEATQRNNEIGMLAKAFSSRTRQLEIALASLDATNLALEQQLDVQQQAQMELKEKKEQLNTVLNSAHNLIFINDINGTFTLVNDQFCQTLGRNRENILGSKTHLVMPKEIAQLNSKNDQYVINTKIELSYEQTFPSKDKQHTYLVTKFPILDEQGQVTAVGTIAFDISATKALELKKKAQFEILRQETSENIRFIEKLEQTNRRLLNESNQAKSESNRAVNFERVKVENQALYPSLVAAIVKPIFRKQDDLAASAYRLTTGELDPLEFNHALAAQTERLRHLEYLFSAQDYLAKPIDLVLLLEHIVALLQPKLISKNINLTIKSDKRLIVDGVHWHFLLIFYRAISNTINDAFYQQSEQNKIEVKLDKTAEMITMELRDNGRRLSDEQLEKIHNTLKLNEVTGTLSALSIWLKSEFNGELIISTLSPDTGYTTLQKYHLANC